MIVRSVASLAVCALLAGLPQAPVFRTVGHAVSVPVSVKQGNASVAGLTASDFRLWDSGAEQRVSSVTFEDVPIDVTLFFDNSGSTASLHEKFNEDMRTIAALLRPVDRIRVLSFALDVRVVLDWTSPGAGDVTVGDISHGRLSSVYDALYMALSHRPEPGRRHLVVAMTDGQDVGGVVRSRDVEHLAQRTEGVLHWLFVAPDTRSRERVGARGVGGVSPDADGERRLRRAAELTGGLTHAPAFRINVVDFFTKAFDDFRTSYVLHYAPTGVPKASWHPIKVEVTRPGRLTIRHRQGYLAFQ